MEREMQTQTTLDMSNAVHGLRGKSAIITGSTSGIGLGTARAFAKPGIIVLFNAFGAPSGFELLRKELERGSGISTAYSGADMSNPDDIAQMIDDARAAFGQIDILVNNAGIQHVEAIETFPVSKWNAII